MKSIQKNKSNVAALLSQHKFQQMINWDHEEYLFFYIKFFNHALSVITLPQKSKIVWR